MAAICQCFFWGHQEPETSDVQTYVLASNAPRALAITGQVLLYKCGRCKQLAMLNEVGTK